jgi:hypothetical protein
MAKNFDPTKPVQTREGRQVRIVCIDGPQHNFPLVVYVLGPSWEGGDWCGPYAYASNGLYDNSNGPLDLVNVPTNIE